MTAGGAVVPINLATRLLLEVVAIASLAYWGFRLPSSNPAKVIVAIAAPLLLIAVWAFVVAPGADNPLSPTTRMLIGSLLLLLAAAALTAAGQPKPGAIVAIVIVINTISMLAFPDDPAS
jgi:hypothetical protein